MLCEVSKVMFSVLFLLIFKNMFQCKLGGVIALIGPAVICIRK